LDKNNQFQQALGLAVSKGKIEKQLLDFEHVINIHNERLQQVRSLLQQQSLLHNQARFSSMTDLESKVNLIAHDCSIEIMKLDSSIIKLFT
jgi:hypothetical protein